MLLWDRFTEVCNLRFGPAFHGTSLSELARLPFVSTIQDYADRFNIVLCHTRALSVSQKGKLFIGGLLEPIRIVWVQAHVTPKVQVLDKPLTHATIAIQVRPHRCHLIRNIHQQTQHNEQPAHYWRNMHGVAFTGHLLKQKHGGVMSSLSTQLHQYVSFTIIPINQVPSGHLSYKPKQRKIRQSKIIPNPIKQVQCGHVQ